MAHIAQQMLGDAPFVMDVQIEENKPSHAGLSTQTGPCYYVFVGCTIECLALYYTRGFMEVVTFLTTSPFGTFRLSHPDIGKVGFSY